VSEKEIGWHHCGKCGEVYFAAERGALCTACGRTPIPLKKKITVHAVEGNSQTVRKEFSPNLAIGPIATPKLVRIESHQDSSTAIDVKQRERTDRVRKKNYTLAKFIAGWCLLLCIAATAIYIKNSKEAARINPVTKPEENASSRQQSIDIDIMNRSEAEIYKTAAEFFQVTAPEMRAAYCLKRPRLVQTMNLDGAKAMIFNPEVIPALMQRNVIHPAGIACVETVWQDARGRQVELVFREQDQQWLVDWESYAKSSEKPWIIFQSENDEAEATFRLLMRERSVSRDAGDASISLIFYEPGFFHGADLGAATPEILVDRRSRTGKLLVAALAARMNEEPVYGSMYPSSDPPNTARVHVKIRRSIVNGEKIFTITKLIACHWMGIDDIGIELTDGP
jgi:hypothetical protein